MSTNDRLDKMYTRLARDGRSENVVVDLFPPRHSAGGPLQGLAFACKANMDYAGYPTSVGMDPPLLPKAATTAALIQTFESAGAACLCSSNCDELCADFLGNNQFFGNMQNPHDRDRLALGSSGGPAICVAKAYTDFALGSDFGGSVRAPAAACGVLGLKLSTRQSSSEGIFRYHQTLDSPGLFAADFGILERLTTVLSSAHPTPSPIQRILVPSPEDRAVLSPPYAKQFSSVCECLSKRFEVAEAPSLFAAAFAARRTLAIVAIEHRLREFSARSADFPRSVQAILKAHSQLGDQDISRAELDAKTLREKLQQLLPQDTFLLSPTLCDEPPLRNFPRSNTQTALHYFLPLANLCDLTALSIPLARQGVALPFAVQLISSRELPATVSTARYIAEHLDDRPNAHSTP